MGATTCRLAIAALSKTRDRRSNNALRTKTRRSISLACCCSITCGGTAVASESKVQDFIERPPSVYETGGCSTSTTRTKRPWNTDDQGWTAWGGGPALK